LEIASAIILLADHKTIAHSVFSTRMNDEVLRCRGLRACIEIVLVRGGVHGLCRLVRLERKVISRGMELAWKATRENRVNWVATLAHVETQFRE